MTGGGKGGDGRVLVVEHDAAARAAIVEALGSAIPDVTVGGVADGIEAWQRLQDGSVDVLLSDVMMPGIDGITLARKVRELPATSGVYIILLTGIAPPERLFSAIEQGADDCLLEPLRMEELVVRVRAGLRRVALMRVLESRAAELERLYGLQSEFLSWVSHEIRTPLSAIQSSANILLRYGKKNPDSVERFARVIHQEGQRLTRLINNLLDLAKIEAGEVAWSFSAVPLNGLLERVRQSFDALAGEHNVRLDVVFTHGPAAVVVDGDKLTQVLVNLVSNAIKHSPEGGLIRLRCLPLHGGGARLEVEDEGPGIPAGEEERIFERFQQLDAGEDRRGTGLGLTIARQIVEHHGGKVWATPGRASGALFVVELPAAPGQELEHGAVR